MTWLQMYTRYTRGSKGWYRTAHAAVPPNGGFRSSRLSPTGPRLDADWKLPPLVRRPSRRRFACLSSAVGVAARSPRPPLEASAAAIYAAGMTDRAIPPSLRDGTDQPIFERSAGRRLRLARRPPASARSRPAVQSALDRVASAGHSYARSSGSPLESEASANLSFLGQNRMDNLLKAHS